MRAYTQEQIELINAVDDLLEKRREGIANRDAAIKKVEDLLQKRIGRNV